MLLNNIPLHKLKVYKEFLYFPFLQEIAVKTAHN